MRLFLASLCAMCFLLAPPSAQEANAQVLLGPRAGFDLGDADQVFLGADLRAGVPQVPVAFIPAFDFYFTDPTALNIDVNVVYFFEANGRQTFFPYAGTGLGFFQENLDDGWEGSTGLNLLGGVEIGDGDFRPYVQAKTSFGGDVSLANLMIGFALRL